MPGIIGLNNIIIFPETKLKHVWRSGHVDNCRLCLLQVVEVEQVQYTGETRTGFAWDPSLPGFAQDYVS